MAYEVTLPRLGWDMEEGALGGWLKKEGEFVNAGDLLFTVEGDKAVQEIEALDSGYLRISPAAPAPGTTVPVGTLLGYLVPEDELKTFSLAGPAEDAPVDKPPAVLYPTAELSTSQTPGRLPSSRPGQRVYISPYARRLAESQGVDWRAIPGSGREGRIMSRDVETAMMGKTAQPAAAAPPRHAPARQRAPTTAQPASATNRAAMSPVRRSIAEHMAASARTVAPVTLTCEVDATQLVALRRQLKEDWQKDGDPAPTYNDMLAKIAAKALLEHPEVNSRLDGDEIVTYTAAHVAVAVDTDRGLLVPVLREVQDKSLRQVAREAAALVERTRLGTASYDDLQGGTFTITNLGMFEIEAFTPIINLPQCAVLGVGQIIARQVVIDAEQEVLVIQQRMALSLTFDHRLVDGAQAARFLQRIKRLVEQPYLWLSG